MRDRRPECSCPFPPREGKAARRGTAERGGARTAGTKRAGERARAFAAGRGRGAARRDPKTAARTGGELPPSRLLSLRHPPPPHPPPPTPPAFTATSGRRPLRRPPCGWQVPPAVCPPKPGGGPVRCWAVPHPVVDGGRTPLSAVGGASCGRPPGPPAVRARQPPPLGVPGHRSLAGLPSAGGRPPVASPRPPFSGTPQAGGRTGGLRADSRCARAAAAGTGGCHMKPQGSR